MHTLEDRENPRLLTDGNKQRKRHRRINSNILEDISNMIDPGTSSNSVQANSKKINKSSSLCIEDTSSYKAVYSVTKMREENKKINKELKKTLENFTKANIKALTKREQVSRPPLSRHKRLWSTAITSEINTNNENERVLDQIFHMKEKIKDIHQSIPEVSLGHQDFIDQIKKRIQQETLTPKPGCSCSSCFIF